jgi:conjugative transfer pilus assembly protein TraH
MKTLSLFLITLTLTTYAHAGLEDEMSGMFADMLNATPGGYYDTQRRGVITGGNLATRNKVLHPNLVSFVPPSFKGGCGGIDLFGGSFSYINGTQITSLLRSITQGAVGYAFQLAIEGMCPTCSQVMTKLQKDIAEINSIMKNSCEASKSVVNATGLMAWHDKRLNDAANLDTSKGFLPDFHEAKENKNPNQVALTSGAADEITGNVVHEALNEASAVDWFVNGDDQLKRVLMSLTGTMIIGKKDDNSDVRYDYRQPTIEMRDFIEGGDLKIYKCDTDECLLDATDSTETIHVTGMREKVRTMLFGTCNCATGTGGIIRKLADRESGTGFDANEDKFIKTSSPGILGLLHRVSSQPGSAALVGEQMIGVLATSLTNQMIDEMYEAVRHSVSSTGRPLDSSMLKVLESRRQQIDNERRLNGESTASISNVLDMLDDVERSLHKNRNHKI